MSFEDDLKSFYKSVKKDASQRLGAISLYAFDAIVDGTKRGRTNRAAANWNLTVGTVGAAPLEVYDRKIHFVEDDRDVYYFLKGVYASVLSVRSSEANDVASKARLGKAFNVENSIWYIDDLENGGEFWHNDKRCQVQASETVGKTYSDCITILASGGEIPAYKNELIDFDPADFN